MGEALRGPREAAYGLPAESGKINGRPTVLDLVDISDGGACVLLFERMLALPGDRMTVRGRPATVRWARQLPGATQVGVEFDRDT